MVVDNDDAARAAAIRQRVRDKEEKGGAAPPGEVTETPKDETAAVSGPTISNDNAQNCS